MLFPQVIFSLPAWVEDFLASQPKRFPTPESRMQLAVQLSQTNVDYRTGGPFGAAIFETSTQTLIAPGVNMVMTLQCSIAHAETLAIMIAQKVLGTYHLVDQSSRTFELVCSTEPCSMCLGAIHWAGIQHLMCGAREEDARKIGFDEGLKPPHWERHFEQQGMTIVRDVAREDACRVLSQYHQQGGVIYNP